jgi:creatinine amidohydrolase
MVDYDRMKGMGPKDARKLLGDGNFGGYYEKSDDDMMALWNVAVEETRTLIETNWQ